MPESEAQRVSLDDAPAAAVLTERIRCPNSLISALYITAPGKFKASTPNAKSRVSEGDLQPPCRENSASLVGSAMLLI